MELYSQFFDKKFKREEAFTRQNLLLVENLQSPLFLSLELHSYFSLKKSAEKNSVWQYKMPRISYHYNVNF